MTSNHLYNNFFQKWQEVTALPTQQVGPFTPVYKRVVPFFKTSPWRILIPVAIALVLFILLMHQLTAVQVATILQGGF